MKRKASADDETEVKQTAKKLRFSPEAIANASQTLAQSQQASLSQQQVLGTPQAKEQRKNKLFKILFPKKWYTMFEYLKSLLAVKHPVRRVVKKYNIFLANMETTF